MSEYGYNPLWFTGVVVQTNDPQNSGRVKVRAHGIHPPDPANIQDARTEENVNGIERPLNIVEDEDLPWAMVLQGATMGVPRALDLVFGCFLDGRDAQHPIIFGTIPSAANGIPGPNPTGGDPYTPSIPAAALRFGEAPMDPWISGEQVGTTPAVMHMGAWTIGFPSGQDEGWQMPSPQIANGDQQNRVIRGGESNNRVVVGNSGVVLQSENAQIQIDGNGNVAIYSDGQVAFHGEDVNSGANAKQNHYAGGAYRITSGAGGVTIDTDGDFTVNCSAFKVNARDQAYLNAGGSADIRGAKVSLQSQTDNIDVWAKGKTRIYSGGTMTLESGGFEGMFITSKRVNWFNYLDFKLTSLIAVDINTPLKMKIQGTYSDFVGTAVSNFKSNGVTNVYGSLVNIDRFVNMGSGASLPPLPLTPLEIGLHIGLPLGPLLSGHFAEVPDLPVLKGSNIKITTNAISGKQYPMTDITSGMIDD